MKLIPSKNLEDLFFKVFRLAELMYFKKREFLFGIKKFSDVWYLYIPNSFDLFGTGLFIAEGLYKNTDFFVHGHYAPFPSKEDMDFLMKYSGNRTILLIYSYLIRSLGRNILFGYPMRKSFLDIKDLIDSIVLVIDYDSKRIIYGNKDCLPCRNILNKFLNKILERNPNLKASFERF